MGLNAAHNYLKDTQKIPIAFNKAVVGGSGAAGQVQGLLLPCDRHEEAMVPVVTV